jgi:hypothetical protein
MIDRKLFFRGLRRVFGPFNAVQVKVINATLDEWERRRLQDLRWLSYMLSTQKGECNFEPVREIGRGRGKPYGLKHKATGQVYYGRGLVQLTWFDNYAKMGVLLGLPLVQEPDMALEIPVAVAILFEGMTTGVSARGDFTGHHLGEYFNATTDDPLNARRIINGRDKASQFAAWHREILKVLQASLVEAPAAPQPAPAPDAPVVETPAKGDGTGKAAGATGAGAAATGGALLAAGFDAKWILAGMVAAIIIGVLVFVLRQNNA